MSVCAVCMLCVHVLNLDNMCVCKECVCIIIVVGGGGGGVWTLALERTALLCQTIPCNPFFSREHSV